MPYYHQSGGFLDNVVDGWHTAFNLPDGRRNRRAENLIEFTLANADGRFFELNESASGLGDIQISVARRVGSGAGWILRGGIKLPTGRERILAGSGATDYSLSAMRIFKGSVRGHEAGYYVGAALIEPGQPDYVLYPVEDRAVAAILGGALALGKRFGIKGQIDAHSALYDSQLEEIGQTSVQATVGGWMHFGEAALFEYGIGEDLHVSTTPDVVLVFNLSWQLR